VQVSARLRLVGLFPLKMFMVEISSSNDLMARQECIAYTRVSHYFPNKDI
jgi:hypothetical protein